jgi:hypothetical protein
MAEAARTQRRPKKPDLQSTLKKVVGAGLTVSRIEVDRDGKQIIHMMADARPVDDLDRELAEFEQRNGQG